MPIRVKQHYRKGRNKVTVVRQHVKKSAKKPSEYKGIHSTHFENKQKKLLKANPNMTIGEARKVLTKKKSRNYMKESEGMGKPKGYTKEHSMRKKANIKARRLESPKKPLKRKSNKPTPGKYKSGGW